MLVLDAEAAEELDTRDRTGARARDHDLDVGELLVRELARVEQAGARDDRGAVLIVVKHGDSHPLAELLLDLEARRRRDVLEVDPAERRLECGDDVAELVDVLLGDLEIEDIDVGELLEQARLALHHRLAGGGPDVAEAEDGGAVRDHRDEIAARRVLPRQLFVARDLETRLGDAGRVRVRQIDLADERLGRDDLEFSFTSAAVILERVVLTTHALVLSLATRGDARRARKRCASRAESRLQPDGEAPEMGSQAFGQSAGAVACCT